MRTSAKKVSNFRIERLRVKIQRRLSLLAHAFFKNWPHLQVGDFVDEVAAVVGAVGVVADEAIGDFDFESLLAMQLDSSLLLAVPLVVDVWVIGDG